MNAELRKKVILAMELLARSINDESIFMSWLMCGVPDGDIPYGSFSIEDVDDSYIEDETFSRLMEEFLRCMKYASDDGGLYVDKVVSK